MIDLNIKGRVNNGILTFQPVFLGEDTSCDVNIHVMSSNRVLRMEDIVKVVSDILQISVENMRSTRRGKNDVVYARQFAVFFCRKKTQFHLTQIGLFFGGRDHSTVIHSIAKIQEQLDLEERRIHKLYTETYILINEALSKVLTVREYTQQSISLQEAVKGELKKILSVNH